MMQHASTLTSRQRATWIKGLCQEEDTEVGHWSLSATEEDSEEVELHYLPGGITCKLPAKLKAVSSELDITDPPLGWTCEVWQGRLLL